MSIENVKNYLKNFGRDQDVVELELSSATVELAAAALGVEGERIAKTIAFRGNETEAMLIVTAGDAKIDNKKFRAYFGMKARML